jgi:PhoPQ-activated pathogenicity-related protein
MIHRFLLALILITQSQLLIRAESPAPPSDLVDYVRKQDASFAWKMKNKTETNSGTIYEIDLTSQTWHEIKWTHKVCIYWPKGTEIQKTMVLWNQGGTPSPSSQILGFEIAKKVGAPIAFLYGIPNQPLFGGKKEDTLIAETFVRYLETKDPTWPLLFPMVKSLVKTMDALQAFAKEEWKADLKSFVVTGASKRGWTSWLTAATGDPRVKAIAPLVIDTLNFPAQMKNQLRAFGKPSEMIHDYTERNLTPIPESGEGRRLWSMVDPWVYRNNLTLPKMIINGANDPYWPLDALNSYWNDLQGDKHLLYVPNAGHDLRQTDKEGKKELLPARALNTLAGFCRCQIFDKPMPKMTWKYADNENGVTLEVGFEGTLKSQRVWIAEADTRDFRKARWSEQLLQETKGGAKVVVKGPVTTQHTFHKPKTGYRAMIVETEFEFDGLSIPLSTQIRILAAKD